MDRDKKAFFESVQRQERESKKRRANDPEHHKRWMLKSASGGFGRGSTPKAKITLPKMSWDKSNG